jgi:HlyD family type I secretion membrane fusion protein
VVLVLVLVGGSVVWAANFAFGGATIAPGVVVVERERMTIQHPEGGTIKEILISEGERVSAGQPLIRFDDTHPKAALGLLRERLLGAIATHARLVAERDRTAEIAFPDELTRLAAEPEIAEIMTREIDLFKARRSRKPGQEKALRSHVGKLEREASALRSKVQTLREHLKLNKEETQRVEAMAARGEEDKAALRILNRRRAEIESDIADCRKRIVRAEEGINHFSTKLRLPKIADRDHAAEEVQAAEAEIAGLRDRLRAAEDILGRTEVFAPRSGRVVELQVDTIGGVVQPGNTLLVLVPDLDRLIIDVRVDPKDIADVYPGMRARVRLTAFDTHATPMLDGTVASVSADRMTDQATGEPYFAARVVLPAESAPFSFDRLNSGMRAEVVLETAKRTALDYLIQPLVRKLADARRDQ